jgi:hypothetical protein
MQKCSVAKLQQSILNFNHHEVIPQLPEGQHHCEATSLRSNITVLHLTDLAYSVGVMPNFSLNWREK